MLTGRRIRDHRLLAGLKQADLAKKIGISAAYLNLIEHDRRKIGGKILNDIAQALGVSVKRLSEGAEAELIEALQSAGRALPAGAPALEPPEEFATRFPGWAALVTALDQRITDLDRLVESLTDRLSNDPGIAHALHDVLTTASAIGSAAAILNDTQDIEAAWRDRFHRNIHEDSQRLAEASQSLVQFLEGSGATEAQAQSPEDAVFAWLEAQEHHIAGLERALTLNDELLFAEPPGLEGAEARQLAGAILKRYRADAAAMPLAAFSAAAEEMGFDPVALAHRFGVELPAVFRRLANLPRQPNQARIGLAICDNSGDLTYRKPLGGFVMPRFGGGCPSWPLYQALSRPMVPVRAVIETTGRERTRYLAYAIAAPLGGPRFDSHPVFEATMLLLPRDRVGFPDEPPQIVGTNCRLMPCPACAERRGALPLDPVTPGVEIDLGASPSP
jgi:predicted transcriptional regulator/DNA-binding XRE family transcriptional regulator